MPQRSWPGSSSKPAECTGCQPLAGAPVHAEGMSRGTGCHAPPHPLHAAQGAKPTSLPAASRPAHCPCCCCRRPRHAAGGCGGAPRCLTASQDRVPGPAHGGSAAAHGGSTAECDGAAAQGALPGGHSQQSKLVPQPLHMQEARTQQIGLSHHPQAAYGTACLPAPAPAHPPHLPPITLCPEVPTPPGPLGSSLLNPLALSA